jgi:hypothetical protein
MAYLIDERDWRRVMVAAFRDHGSSEAGNDGCQTVKLLLLLPLLQEVSRLAW